MMATRSRGVIALVLGVGMLAGGLFGASPASAAPNIVWQGCTTGSGAGECRIARGIVANPSTGDLYVSDQENLRIDEFTAWGEFLRAWGWGVRTGDPELQTCTTQTGCQRGLSGSGSGEFLNVTEGPQGIALDSTGDVYVYDLGNHRVQKFSPTGEFILMFGGGVDKATGGNVCTVVSGDSCGSGSVGSAPGEFDLESVYGSYLSVGLDDEVYVGDKERIQKFTTDGTYQASLLIAGETILSLAVDQSGDLFAAFSAGRATPQAKPGVRKLSPTGEVLCTAAAQNPTALATGPSGELFTGGNPSFPKTVP